MTKNEGVARIGNVIALFRKWMNSRKISTKIALFYFVLLMFAIAASSIFYQRIYSGIIYDKVGEMSIQTLDSISSNLDTVIENVDKDSKAIFTNDDLQRMLKNPKPYLDLETANRVKAYLIKLTESMPDISSVYLFDHAGNRFAMDKIQNKTLAISDITKASWYRKAEESKGYYILRLNAGDIFDRKNGRNFISLIRVINDLQNQRSIGYLVVNIPVEAFVSSYKDLGGKYGIRIILLDENDRKITEEITAFDSMIPGLTGNGASNTRFVKMDRIEYQVSYLETEYNWKIISIAPFRELSRESGIFSLIAFLVNVLNSVLLFLGSIFISRLVTNPVKKLLNAMKGIENNQFGTVDLQMGSNEFERLQEGYNRMVIEIHKLIKNIMEEQKVKRKAELDVLQAQIKPHFLYNTFDAISYLALEGRSDKVYTIMKALGSYYRTSLSKGSEVITLREEVELVKNYLTIQKIRYNDLFTDNYEIEDGIAHIRILKLVLQPLVENALYHGIKPKGEPGHIGITAVVQDGFVILTVRDDGVGMRKEKIREILSGRKSTDETSFGLKGTIERLRIFYGIDDVLSFKSPSWGGTEVILTIPLGRCGSVVPTTPSEKECFQ